MDSTKSTVTQVKGILHRAKHLRKHIYDMEPKDFYSIGICPYLQRSDHDVIICIIFVNCFFIPRNGSLFNIKKPCLSLDHVNSRWGILKQFISL
jgi:hypothetical protein